MTYEHQPEPDELMAWEAARKRHPSWVDTLDHHHWHRPHVVRPELGSDPLEVERRTTEAMAALHDFFRFGDADATGALENYLHEHSIGLHAEVLLDLVADDAAERAERLRASGGVIR
jgi:hypothetical protein